MDSAKLILTEPVSLPNSLENLTKSTQTNNISEEQKKQIAKDFESVFIEKVLDKMKDTIGDVGFGEDSGASKQIHGIFWLYLARDIANKGGFGMWKDIYNNLINSGQQKTNVESLDNSI